MEAIIYAPLVSAHAYGAAGYLRLSTTEYAYSGDAVQFTMQDAGLAAKLAAAINRTIAEHRAAPVQPVLQAAE